MREKGFTLIELLVVVAIIGILASVIIAALNSAREKARNARRKADAHELVTALQLYMSDNSGNMVGCGADRSNNPTYLDGTGCMPQRLASYMPSLPVDPVNDSTYNYLICTNGSGCNGTYSTSPYWVEVWLEPSATSQVFFVY